MPLETTCNTSQADLPKSGAKDLNAGQINAHSGILKEFRDFNTKFSEKAFDDL